MLDAEAETQLREIIQEYPYFSNAWLLLTRSLHNQNSPKFDASLKQTSMYAGDRDLLYKLVNITDGEEEKKASFTKTKETVIAIETPAQEAESPIIVEEAKEEIKITTPAIEETLVAATQEIKETKEAIAEELVTENIAPLIETEKELNSFSDIEDKVENEAQETKESIEEEIINFENTFEETVQDTEPEITAEVDETAKTFNSEQEKVKSAYEEIFGSQDDTEEDTVSTEFETFDVNDREGNDEPALPDFDEDDFVLQVDENDSEDLMADEMASIGIANEPETTATTSFHNTSEDVNASTTQEGNDILVEEPTADTIEEAITSDTITESTAPQETYVEEAEFELEASNLQNNEESESVSTKVEGVESELGETINTNLAFNENEIDSIPNEVESIVETVNENTETAIVDNAISENEIEALSETPNNEAAIDNSAEEVNTVDEAIAFKLESTETTEVIETQENIEQVSAPIQNPNFTEASNFFEWLTQLKNPEKEEKKNDITQGAISTVVSQSHQSPIYAGEDITEAVSERKPDADAIIERFIKINPTISRPKAEFYNPEAKSKESDTESDDLATETLAKIYTDQNLNDKAIEVYQRLIVLYPAKAAEYTAIIAELESE